jgi:hypothetical protein
VVRSIEDLHKLNMLQHNTPAGLSLTILIYLGQFKEELYPPVSHQISLTSESPYTRQRFGHPTPTFPLCTLHFFFGHGRVGMRVRNGADTWLGRDGMRLES